MKLKRVAVILLAGLLMFQSVSASKAQEPEKNYSNKDLRIMASIIWCEAGNQSYAGKLAVGCVIMNRVKSSNFPSTVRGVVYQKWQFSPTWEGQMKKALKAYDGGRFQRGARLQCVRAAKAALSGQTYVVSKGKKINMKRYHFFSGSLSHAKVRISGHSFK